MRILKNILLFFCLLGTLVCNAHEIDPITTEVDTNKAYSEYFNNYAERLYNNFRPEEHFRKGWYQGNNFLYVIRRDGTIENLIPFFKKDRFERYGEKVIKATVPYPFPEEIKDEIIMVNVWLQYAHEDSCKLVLYGRSKYRASFYWKKYYDLPSIQVVNIYLERDARKKK